ncbi:MAG: hypothetical protein ACLQBA_15505 [Candidatus Binataceae bacterium]
MKSSKTKRARIQTTAHQKTKPAKVESRKGKVNEAEEWLFPIRESAYTKLALKGKELGAKSTRKSAAAQKSKTGRGFRSTLQPGAGEEVLASLSRDYWLKHIQEFQRRKVDSPYRGHGLRGGGGAPGLPVVPGSNNWIPLGPSVEARGQADGRPAVSGRIPGIAIAPGGSPMYVATASGGVWVSNDFGASWASTMDGFDLNTSAFAATCLACGAIAIDPADPDRVYVGTGEGDTDAIFQSRLVDALPCYRGVGPIRSDDGGATWNSEPSNPSLAGYSFYQIAVDPANRDHCVAATSNGLYERIPAGGGSYQWQQRRTGSHSSVVVTSSGGVTQWFAGAWAGSVYTSTDGTNWTVIGTGFPTGITRIALAVQPDNPNVLYAALSSGGPITSVQRLDGAAGAWRSISGIPTVCPGSQGDYDLAIAVDPNNANLLYLGGDRIFDSATELWGGSVWCCVVTSTGSSLSMTSTSLGLTAHSDDHVLMFTPGNSNALWLGSDGGLFFNANPSGGGAWTPMNTSLATLCTTHFAQHPTQPAVMLCGLQDNGSAKYVGEEVWTDVLGGDGGYSIVNWSNPFNILLYADGSVNSASDGGIDLSSWTDVTPSGAEWEIMESPLVSAPYNPSSPSDANIVAFASGSSSSFTVFISSNFGSTWPAQVNIPASSGTPYSMVGASAQRFYLGTSTGEVYRLDEAAGSWTATRIDNVAGGALPLTGLVSDIAIDTSDPTLNSIYICFGGSGDYRHVWHFNGTAWQARSGTAGSSTCLLDIEHNAIQFDSVSGSIFVGADLGVWQSTDSGNTWNPMANGLPDAPVFDLQLHPTQRLLRASLHGRGLWEWKLDLPIQPDVELLIRDTLLDYGTEVDDDGLPDPSVPPGSTVVHYESPNIKVDVPTPLGYQTPTTSIDFLTFNEVIVDGSQGVGTNSPPPTVHNRVYAEIHNRGRVDAGSVQVMLLLADASAGLPLLPGGYTANVVAGTPITAPDWTTLGFVTLSGLHAGSPQIAYFDLPSTVLPLPASLPGQSHYCLLVLLHSPQDPFTSTVQVVDTLTLMDRKVAQKNLNIVQFIGTPPPPSEGPGMWSMLNLTGSYFRDRGFIDIVVDASRFPGTISLVLPPNIFPRDIKKQADGFRLGSASLVSKWFKEQSIAAKRLFYEAKYPEAQYRKLVDAMERVKAQKPLVLVGGRSSSVNSLSIEANQTHTAFLRIDPPPKSKPGADWSFDVFQREAGSGKSIGGCRYRVVINRKA